MTTITSPTSTPPAFEQPFCGVYEETFGLPPTDSELLELVQSEGRGPDTIVDIALQGAMGPIVNRPEELTNGEGAEKLQRALGCANCALRASGCILGEALKDDIDAGALEKLGHMLKTAPPLLTLARLSLLKGKGILEDPTSGKLVKDPTALLEAVDSGKITPSELLGGVTNELIGLVDKSQIPEVTYMDGFDDGVYPLTRLTAVDSGEEFHFIDVSSGHVNGVAPLNPADEMVLAAKTFRMICDLDSGGKPQILNVEGSKMKPIRDVEMPDGSECYEVRMAGKNRIYLGITPGNGTEPVRIVFFGGHGGNGNDQVKFINKVLSPSAQTRGGTPFPHPRQGYSHSSKRPLSVH